MSAASVVTLRTLALCLVVSACLGASCAAVRMDVAVGFDGALKGSAWTALAVTLSNTSDEDVEGTLAIVQPDSGQRGLPRYAARVTLPAKSRKLYHIYAKFPEYGGDTQVVLTRGRGTLALKKVRVDPTPAEDKLVVSVGGRATRLNYLSGLSLPVPGSGPSGSSSSTVHVGSVPVKLLPDRPAAYEGVDLLVVSDLSPASANPKALGALAMWVASGGTLVVSGGPNYRLLQDPFYADLLPVRVTGTANLAGAVDLRTIGKSNFPAGAVAVTQGQPKQGIARVLVSEGETPLVVERSYGAGRVVFLALDYLSPPFRDWNGQTDFWKSFLTSGGPAPMVRSVSSLLSNQQPNQYAYNSSWDVMQSSIAAVVTQSPSVQTPSFNTIGLFLLAYLIVLAPVNYFVLRKKRRLELAWVSTPAIVLVFSLGAYAIGYTMKGGSLSLREATFIEATSGARYARALTCASLFSPARRSYDIEINDPLSLSQVISTDESEQFPEAYVAESSTIGPIPMAMWSSKTFESSSGVDLGGPLVANLTLNGRRLEGTIRNNTGMSFDTCTVYFGGGSCALGGLPKGQSRQVSVEYRRPASGPYNDFGHMQDGLRFRSFAESAVTRLSQPVLLAWPSGRSAVFSTPGQSPSVASQVCCAFRLDVKSTHAATGSGALGFGNLVTNGGFESGTNSWASYGTYDQPPTGSWYGSITARSGQRYIGSAASGGLKTGGLYQVVLARPGAKYQATAWSRVYRTDNPSDSAICKVGIDRTGGTSPGSPNVQWSKPDSQPRSGFSEWHELSTPVVTSAGNQVTIFLHMKHTNPPGWHITCFDDAGVYER